MESSIQSLNIKNLNYASADCQCLIREYTQLIAKMTKEYDVLVSENRELFQRVQQLNALLESQSTNQPEMEQTILLAPISHQTGSYSYFKAESNIKKIWKNLQCYGLWITLKRVKKRLFH